MLRSHLPCHPTPACVAHAIWRWAALHNRASGPGRSEGCGIVGRATGASFTATDGPAAQRDAKDPRGSPTGGETLGHQGRHRVLPPDEFDAGRRTCICAVHALYVHCGCTVHSRHLNSVQAPPREANEALVYATKQVQFGPGLGLRYMECTTTHAVHHTVHITSQVGQNNSFPWHTDHGTFYKVCRGPNHPSACIRHRIKDAHRTPSNFRLPTMSQSSPLPSPQPLPRVKSPEPRAPHP